MSRKFWGLPWQMAIISFLSAFSADNDKYPPMIVNWGKLKAVSCIVASQWRGIHSSRSLQFTNLAFSVFILLHPQDVNCFMRIHLLYTKPRVRVSTFPNKHSLYGMEDKHSPPICSSCPQAYDPSVVAVHPWNSPFSPIWEHQKRL